jgi:hypothetical protein
MSFLPFFQAWEATGLGEAIRGSLWLFPLIESIHLVALAAIGGAVLIVDLRLLGLGLRNRPVSPMARDIHPWLIGSLVVMLVSGLLLATSEAVKLYYSPAFRVKISSFLLAIIFTFTIRRKLLMSEPNGTSPWRSKLVGMISVTLWSSVGMAGRWIGFS